MDIQKIMNYSKNKIEADDLTKQVRRQIKETAWEKQNQREGFSETFKPLISQFEKPDDPKKKNIFTQNQEMLRNQLALTEGLRDNQRAIPQGFSQFERLADMKELPGVEAFEDEEEDEEDETETEAQVPKEKKSQAPIAKFNVEEFNRKLNNKEKQDLLERSGYKHLPSYYFERDVEEISSLINDVNSDLKNVGDKISNNASIEKDGVYSIAKAKREKPHLKTINNINIYNALSIYSTNLELLCKFKKQSGSGMFFTNPEELLKRFELLSGSLAAGNNGVLPEYIQLAHRLRDLGVITNNQLNKLLKGNLRFPLLPPPLATPHYKIKD